MGMPIIKTAHFRHFSRLLSAPSRRRSHAVYPSPIRLPVFCSTRHFRSAIPDPRSPIRHALFAAFPIYGGIIGGIWHTPLKGNGLNLLFSGAYSSASATSFDDLRRRTAHEYGLAYSATWNAFGFKWRLRNCRPAPVSRRCHRNRVRRRRPVIRLPRGRYGVGRKAGSRSG